MMGWICAAVSGVVLLLLVAHFVTTGRHYKRMFGDEHLVEFAGGMLKLKAAALADVEVEGEKRLPQLDDPRVLRTSAGLMVLYTITREAGAYVHHYSLRNADRGYTAHAVGGTFTPFAAMVLGVDPRELKLERSENRVYHAEFTFDESRQREFEARQDAPPAPAQCRAMHGEAMKVRDALTFNELRTGLSFAG